MKTTKHTPTPWKLSHQDGDYFEDKPKTCIFADTKPFQTTVAFDIGNIQQTKEQRETDAAHIVKCVNMHDELVSELSRAKEELLRRTNIDTDDWFFIANIENLLKRAKNEE